MRANSQPGLQPQACFLGEMKAQPLLKCDLQTRNVSVTWEFVRDTLRPHLSWCENVYLKKIPVQRADALL